MSWLKQFDLFLLDFDGLLVNTEHLHMQAYVEVCKNRGFELPWNFQRYCLAAHFESTGLQKQIYANLPKLHSQEKDWSVLYAEKKRAYLKILRSGAVQLMPGAAELLQMLQSEKIKHCVVTHSPLEQIEEIRKQIPSLNSIPTWFTREHYSQPKPHPECYQLAIQEMASAGDVIIGLEDTPRGLSALQAVPVQAVLISKVPYPSMDTIVNGNTLHFQTLHKLFHNPQT